MKVLKVGPNDPNWKRDFECVGSGWATGCGTIVELEKSDLRVAPCHDIGGERHRVLASCCVCGQEIVVEDPVIHDWGDLTKDVPKGKRH